MAYFDKYKKFTKLNGYQQALQVQIVCAQFGEKPQFRIVFHFNGREFSNDVLFREV